VRSKILTFIAEGGGDANLPHQLIPSTPTLDHRSCSPPARDPRHHIQRWYKLFSFFSNQAGKIRYLPCLTPCL
jgi:hypothetical protein